MVAPLVRRGIQQIEQLVLRDPGGRGVRALAVSGDLDLAARDIYRARTVGISTGFPCLTTHPYHETDGPPGATALARALTVLKRDVIILADATTLPVMTIALAAGGLSNSCTIVHYPPESTTPSSPITVDDGAREMIESAQPGEGAFDVARLEHVVAIERSGRGVDGKHYSMTGRDISEHVESIDDFILACSAPTGCGSTGIGDGGNEVGMGKVLCNVREKIPLGDTIGCTTHTNNLIAAGVSNWGAYGLVAALALVHYEKTGRREGVLEILHTNQRELEIVEALNSIGVVCGRTQAKGVVDGLEVEKDHFEMIDELSTIVQGLVHS